MIEVWSTSQRRVVLGIVLVLMGYLLVRSILHARHVGDPPPLQGDKAQALVDRIDPNTADWPALAALPMVGEARAKDIVRYREERLRASDAPAFERIEDLMKIRGIGEAIIEHLRPHLAFPPSDGATSQEP